MGFLSRMMKNEPEPEPEGVFASRMREREEGQEDSGAAEPEASPAETERPAAEPQPAGAEPEGPVADPQPAGAEPEGPVAEPQAMTDTEAAADPRGTSGPQEAADPDGPPSQERATAGTGEAGAEGPDAGGRGSEGPEADDRGAEGPEADDRKAETPDAESPGQEEAEAEDPDADGDGDRPPRMKPEELIAPSRTPIKGFPIAQGSEDSGLEDVDKAQVISFANQKGGVAKTTTTLNLAVAFAESGHRVLCIDLDPQGNLTMSQGVDPDSLDTSLYDVLVHGVPIGDVIFQGEVDVAPASIDLASAEIAMSTKIGRERSLQKALADVIGDYDFVCVDTPPSLGLLTINALTASDKVIVPVQCEYLSMRGLVQLQNTLRMIQENLNPGVTIEGILPTMLDSRTVHAKEAVEILEESFGDLVFKSRIRKAIKFAEAPVRGSSVLKYDPQGNAANCYRELAQEVLSDGSA